MLTLTERAAGELNKAVAHLPEPRPHLRVYIDHRCHCGAVHFSMGLDDHVREGDTEFEVGGVPFVADPDTVPELSALEIDYGEDFMRRGFIIKNVDHDCGGHR